MRRTFRIGLMLLALLVAAGAVADESTAAPAKGPSFKGTPTFVDEGSSLLVTGTIAGLSPEASGEVAYGVGFGGIGIVTPACHLDTGHVVSGDPYLSQIYSFPHAIMTDQVKKGGTAFSVRSEFPDNLGPSAPGCPPNTVASLVGDVWFLSVTVNVSQVGGGLILSQTFAL